MRCHCTACRMRPAQDIIQHETPSLGCILCIRTYHDGYPGQVHLSLPSTTWSGEDDLIESQSIDGLRLATCPDEAIY